MKLSLRILLLLALCAVLAFTIISCGGSGDDDTQTTATTTNRKDKDDGKDDGNSDGGSGNGGTRNHVPIADAGIDKIYTTGATVTLYGDGSSDKDGDYLRFIWFLLQKPYVSRTTLLNATYSRPTFTPDVDGFYLFYLVANDGTVDSAPDYVAINAVTPGTPTHPIPDTGQTICIDASGFGIDCAGTGQDGEYSINPMAFTNNLDGTITDNITGLMWQKCTIGQNNDATCSGTASYYRWFEASGMANATYNPGGATDVCGSLTLAGYTDWRLPSKEELIGIVNYGTRSLSTAYFPSTETSYWSSDPYLRYVSGAWVVAQSGFAYGESSDRANFVRCVRGQPMTQSFADNGDGTVTDLNTGLIWEQVAFHYCAWEQALEYCNGLSLGGFTDWRLPNVKEIVSIHDDTRLSPMFNTTYLYGNLGNYWSSSPYQGGLSAIWAVDFWDGYYGVYGNGNNGNFRCVR